MKRRAAIFGVVFTLGFGSVSALAGGPTTFAPAGTPGCVGHNEAFFAQVHKTVPVLPAGVGGVAKFLGVTASQLHQSAAANCAAPTTS